MEADKTCLEGASQKILSWDFDEEIFAGGDIGIGVVSLSPNGEHMAIVAMAQGDRNQGLRGSGLRRAGL